MPDTDRCLTYGHCYCQPQHVAGKLHTECCMCQHRQCLDAAASMPVPPPGMAVLIAALQEWQKTHPPKPTAQDLEAHLEKWCGGEVSYDR
jgi:hypothetical protein